MVQQLGLCTLTTEGSVGKLRSHKPCGVAKKKKKKKKIGISVQVIKDQE